MTMFTCQKRCFNPCFNGSMYKNSMFLEYKTSEEKGFNPCFNGSMYKNTIAEAEPETKTLSFNPCFNGSMYKNQKLQYAIAEVQKFQSLF